MAVEAKRGCGYRKVGGLYLVSSGRGVACDRLPIPLGVCPTCGHGIKQTRGWTWIDVAAAFGLHPNCQDDFPCPLCTAPAELGRCRLLWIGAEFYKTPREFDAEADALGISRRISAVPRGFRVGETWIALAHPKAIIKYVPREKPVGPLDTPDERREFPGIFKLWRPQRIEKILTESQRGSAEWKQCLERGITPVFVPDDDPDHAPSKKTKQKESRPRTVEKNQTKGARSMKPIGICRECGEPTRTVVRWDGKHVSLCPRCGEDIRKSDPQKVEKAA